MSWRGIIELGTVLLSLAACRQEVQLLAPGPDASGLDGAVSIPGLTGLSIEPTSLRLVEDGLPPAEEGDFRAFGSFATGTRDVTSEVDWRIETASLGRIEGGHFEAFGVGGRTLALASASGLSANAEIEVALQVTQVLGAPPGAELLFPASTASDTVDAGRLSILYPSHETMFPQNAGQVTHQWSAAPEIDLFQVELLSALGRVRLYTTERSFTPDPEAWRWIGASHAGASLELTVRGLSQAQPQRIYRSQTITLYYARSEVPGTIFYWSTGTKGIRQAELDSAVSSRVFPGDDTCGGCHTVSRDGRRIAWGYDGERLRIADPKGGVIFPPGTSGAREDFGWGSFNPDASRLVYADDGRLFLFDVQAGQRLSEITLGSGMTATHPDWSPDGSFIALALHLPGGGEDPEDLKNKEIEGTSLGRISVDLDGRTGAPQVLVASQEDDDTLYFPSVSPDSAWIAFVRARGKTKDNRSAEIFFVRSDGSEAPVAVDRMNRRVGPSDGIRAIGNSMPTWAQSPRTEIQWLAFSSVRAYGALLPPRDQLWVAAIDPARIRPQDDASFAAFRISFQSIEEGNHRAFWVENGGELCSSGADLCGDGLDNNCNGQIDDQCCLPVAEVCGDGVDNDCDQSIDELCSCAAAEICNNLIDDDCDLAIDGDDSECGGN